MSISLLRRELIYSCMALLVGTTPSRASGHFPVTVRHALGETTITRSPVRVITLGWSGEDVVIALGQVPVAMPRYRFFDSGIFPWNEVRVGSSKPALLDGAIDFEKIAALRPDLILGVYSGIDLVSYKRLSSIAPTVVYRSAPWEADWIEQTTIIGEALGKGEKARGLIAETEGMLRRLGTDNPVLQSKTFAFGTYFPGGEGVVVYLPSDPRVAALTKLGLETSAQINALAAAHQGSSSITISNEQTSSIDADVLIMWYGPGARAAAEAQPLFKMLDAVRRGSYVALEDPVDVWSTSALSVLSIPYGFPRFVPRLAEAAARANGQ